jgi:hypothetical protein
VVAITVVNATVRDTVDDTAIGLAGAADVELRPAGTRPLRPVAMRAAAGVPGVRAVVPTTQQIAHLRREGAAGRALVAGVPPGCAELLPGRLGAAAGHVREPARGGVVLTPHLPRRSGRARATRSRCRRRAAARG